jgi:hypothetical protein
MLVDQIGAGGVGVAAEVAGDRFEQDPALVGGVAVVVAVGAVEAALGVGRAMTDRVLTDVASWRGVGPPVPVRCRLAGTGDLGRAWWRVPLGLVWVLVAGPRGSYSESTQAMVVCSRWS